MSRATQSEVRIGDALDVAAFNASLTSLQTASTTAIDDTNVRDEGLDGRTLATGSVTSASASFDTGSAAAKSNAAWGAAPLTDGTGALIQTSGVNNTDASSEVVVRCSGEISIDASAGTQNVVELAIGYSTDGVTWIRVASSVKPYSYDADVINFKAAGLPFRGVYTVAHRHTTPRVASLQWGLFGQRPTGTGNYTLENFNLSVEVRLR